MGGGGCRIGDRWGFGDRPERLAVGGGLVVRVGDVAGFAGSRPPSRPGQTSGSTNSRR